MAAVIDENNDLYVYLGQDMIIDASNTDMVFTQVFFHTSCKIKSITTTIDGFKAENQFGQDTKYIEITPQNLYEPVQIKNVQKIAHVVFDVNEDFNQNRCQVLPKVKYNDQTDPSRVQVTTDSSTFTYNIQNYTVAVMETNGHVSAYGYHEIDSIQLTTTNKDCNFKENVVDNNYVQEPLNDTLYGYKPKNKGQYANSRFVKIMDSDCTKDNIQIAVSKTLFNYYEKNTLLVYNVDKCIQNSCTHCTHLQIAGEYQKLNDLTPVLECEKKTDDGQCDVNIFGDRSVMWGQKILTNIKDVSQLNATSRP